MRKIGLHGEPVRRSFGTVRDGTVTSATDHRRELNRRTWWLVTSTAVWSLCELPIELLLSQTYWDGIACIVGKALWIALIFRVLARSRAAWFVYEFLCALSVTAIVFNLPTEYRMFSIGFYFSLVECVLKTAAFLSFILSYKRLVSGAEHIPFTLADESEVCACKQVRRGHRNRDQHLRSRVSCISPTRD